MIIEDSYIFLIIDKKGFAGVQEYMVDPSRWVDSAFPRTKCSLSDGWYHSLKETNGLYRISGLRVDYIFGKTPDYADVLGYVLSIGLELYSRFPDSYFYINETFNFKYDSNQNICECWVSNGVLRFSLRTNSSWDVSFSIRINNSKFVIEKEKGSTSDYESIISNANESLKPVLSDAAAESERTKLSCVHVLFPGKRSNVYLCRFGVKVGDRVYVSGEYGNIQGTVTEILEHFYFVYEEGPSDQVLSVVDEKDYIGDSLLFDRYVQIQFPNNKKYSYLCEFDVKVGDTVYVSGEMEGTPGIVNYIYDELPDNKVLCHAQKVLRVERKEETTEARIVSLKEEKKIPEITWEYVENGDGTISISSYKGKEENVVVPDIIDGKKVIKINAFAFTNIQWIKTVTISDGIKVIEKGAFNNCRNLEFVDIPDSVTDMHGMDYGGYGPFTNCVNLKSVKLSQNLSVIDGSTFLGCTSLTSITIPYNVKKIRPYAFYNCTGLESIVFPNRQIYIREYAFYGCSALTTITIPDNWFGIDDGAFEGCENLSTVILPQGITYIYGFRGCTKLSKINIPDSVVSINGAFALTGLTDVKIPKNVSSMDEAFKGCIELTSIEIPGNVESLSQTFAGCSNLTTVIFSEGLKEIADCAFDKCKKLTSITLPQSLETIGTKAFRGCRDIKSITIPDRVERICEYAFNECTRLETVTIPASVKFIEFKAFANCKKLKTVYMHPNTKVDDYAFYNSPEVQIIYLQGNKTEFKTVSESECKNVIPNDDLNTAADHEYPLKDLKFVVTGDLVNFPEYTQYATRDKLKAFIEKKGGKLMDSVSGKTNYLIYNPGSPITTKVLAAREKGIPIISEVEFLNMAGGLD